MKRQYTAHADTGRDFVEFPFMSEHRAGSKKNHEDARREYKARHGYAPKIIRTYRDDADY